MIAIELITAVEANGGHIRVDGPDLAIKPRSAAAPVLEELRQNKAAIIDLLHGREAERDDRLRESFVAWFDSQIWLDMQAIALHRPPRWAAGVAALHRDCGGWMQEHIRAAPPTAVEFVAMLQELSCDIQVIHGEQMVANVCLREDMLAQNILDDS